MCSALSTCGRFHAHDTIRNSIAIGLSPALHRRKIHYRHMPGLGGLRGARPDSANAGWRNASFRGYADYMQTSEFEGSLEDCIHLAKQERIVLMCAEAVPWRCHRSLIADALLARGINAREITSRIRTRPHSLTPFARVKGTHVTYPAARMQCARPLGLRIVAASSPSLHIPRSVSRLVHSGARRCRMRIWPSLKRASVRVSRSRRASLAG